MINIFLIGKHPVMRQGLVSILGKDAGFQIVGESNNVQEYLAQIDELKTEIVIMDASFGNSDDYIKEIAMIRHKRAQVKIFILADSDKEDDFLNAIRAGVRGYLLKDSGVSQLIDAIRLVATDDAVVYSSKMAILFDPTILWAKHLDLLSQREVEILNSVALGKSNREIGNLCFISEATVKNHMKRIMEKLNVKNRAEAVSNGIEKGLLSMAYPQ